MAVTRVGSPSYASGATTVSPSNPQSPTAGNLLLLSVVVANTFTAGTCTTPSGWTAGPTADNAGVTNHVTIFTFWKFAVGGDAAPSITSNSGNITCVLEEFTGVTAGPHDADSAVSVSTATSGTLTNSITTTNASDWIYTAFAGDGSVGTVTWGGGNAQESAVTVGGGTTPTSIATGAQAVSSTGTYSPSATWATSANGACLASMAFKVASTGFTGTGAVSEAVTIAATGALSASGTGTVSESVNIAAAGNMTGSGSASMAAGVMIFADGVVTVPAPQVRPVVVGSAGQLRELRSTDQLLGVTAAQFPPQSLTTTYTVADNTQVPFYRNIKIGVGGNLAITGSGNLYSVK